VGGWPVIAKVDDPPDRFTLGCIVGSRWLLVAPWGLFRNPPRGPSLKAGFQPGFPRPCRSYPEPCVFRYGGGRWSGWTGGWCRWGSLTHRRT
jgi:hypothetical protein